MKRIVQCELLDVLSPEDPRAIRSRLDLRRINGWMCNHVIIAEALEKIFHSNTPGQITEIGAGDGTFLLSVAQKISPRWPDVNATLIDLQKSIPLETCDAFASFGWHAEGVVADVFDWPQTDSDIVIANLFLHHFDGVRLKKLLHLISLRTKFFIAIEPRRNCWSLFFSRLLWAVGCNYITRHDAPVSVRAGFSGNELSALWPDKQNWQLMEKRAGAFSHLFIARKIG